MARVSIVIPSRNEPFLQKTVTDLLNNGGDVEVIAILDGYWPDPPLVGDNRLRIIHHGQSLGMRKSIDDGVAISSGEWIMKSDAHCMYSEGYDAALVSSCDKDWIMIPRRYSLDPEEWKIKEDRPVIDYHYLCCPWTNPSAFSMHGKAWRERGSERAEYDIDDEMSSQGSCWFMHRSFWDWMGGMKETIYGSFSQEMQELGMQAWLGGRRMVVNKNVWYAHLHKGKTYGRGYRLSNTEIGVANVASAKYWLSNIWEKRVHDWEWLIEKFWPVPTWPVDWRNLRIPE